KIDYKHLVAIVYEHLKYYRLLNRTTIENINSTSIRRMKYFREHVEIAYLASKRKKNLVKAAKEMGASALHIEYRMLRQNIIRQCRKAYINLRVYTVTRLAPMHKRVKYGCDSIITDYPDKGIEQFKIFMSGRSVR